MAALHLGLISEAMTYCYSFMSQCCRLSPSEKNSYYWACRLRGLSDSLVTDVCSCGRSVRLVRGSVLDPRRHSRARSGNVRRSSIST